ncbi:craniofacial development protein 2-like [Montipora foliosa]|uniref:craniofacial development protein 2-like n=1 Tax=Montipora foliosa TaxID=591990 RepID=UPI0035F17D56
MKRTKEQFYEQFDQVIRSTPPSDKLIILGDFNARVGKDDNSWEGVLGRHGVGKVNDNGLLLLKKYAEHSLCITNTFFRMADKYNTTWMHPRSKHWHMIDFVIVRQRDIRDVRLTRAMRGAECRTDHRLVRTVLLLHIARPHRKQPKTVRASYNVAGLGNPFRLSKFQVWFDENDEKIKDVFHIKNKAFIE